MTTQRLVIAFVMLLGSESWQQSLSQGCGQQSQHTIKSRRGKRIVGGQVAHPGKWPWIANLIFNNSQYCAGSVVNREWIVTTAHCFHDKHSSLKTEDWLIKVGDFNLKVQESHEQTRKVKSIIRHPNYISMWDEHKVDKPDDNDVALLKLDRPINYTDYVQPICLHQGGLPNFPVGSQCTIAGWGHTQFNGQIQDQLNDVTVELVSRAICNSPKSYNGSVHDRAICAGYEKGGRDACQYDSGGPLVCSKGHTWYLVGQVSWGDKCAQPHKYGVYSNMKVLSPWVRQIMTGK